MANGNTNLVLAVNVANLINILLINFRLIGDDFITTSIYVVGNILYVCIHTRALAICITTFYSTDLNCLRHVNCIQNKFSKS